MVEGKEHAFTFGVPVMLGLEAGVLIRCTSILHY